MPYVYFKLTRLYISRLRLHSTRTSAPATCKKNRTTPPDIASHGRSSTQPLTGLRAHLPRRPQPPNLPALPPPPRNLAPHLRPRRHNPKTNQHNQSPPNPRPSSPRPPTPSNTHLPPPPLRSPPHVLPQQQVRSPAFLPACLSAAVACGNRAGAFEGYGEFEAAYADERWVLAGVF